MRLLHFKQNDNMGGDRANSKLKGKRAQAKAPAGFGTKAHSKILIGADQSH